ncbi:MAG: PP2C family protein-serine/threonine phosphatase [Candidatus Acidiferrales bacterium]
MNTVITLDELQAIEKMREEELEEARSIQSMMMPAESLHTDCVTISHAFQPMAEVGGDFLDYFELSDRTVGIYLGDVSGKGLPAAMYAALAVGTLRGVHKTAQAPGSVVSLLNKRLLIRGLPRRHCALQYAVFQPATRVMQITSAGMPAPLHLSSNGCRSLDLGGIPPGLFATAQYESSTLHLEPGDSVFFCTDGITDAFDIRGDQFGTERLQALCASNSVTRAALLDCLFSAIKKFARGREQSDDMAAALFHFAPDRH